MSNLYCIVTGCRREAVWIFRGNSLCKEHGNEMFNEFKV